MKKQLLAVAMLFSGALAAAPAVALGADSSAQIAPTAQLEARGAYVIATVQITCPVGDTVSQGYPAMLFIQQATSKTTIATGYGFLPVEACTGSPQSVDVPVLATAPGSPFRIGPAEATLTGAACDSSFNCVPFNSGPVTIRIVH